jgi:uncharacterized membrane protein HdeD (DUF308 family)
VENTSSDTVKNAPYYVVSFVRATIVIVPGLFITFTPAHTAQFGLISLGITALVMSVSLGVLAIGLPTHHAGRGLHLWQAMVSLVIGIVVLALTSAGIILLLWALVVWALLMGVAELFAGLRLIKGHVNRSDWIVQGLMTIGLALIVLTQTDDSVAVVGFLGAWAIVLGVYLAIAGVSQKSVDTAAKGSSTP